MCIYFYSLIPKVTPCPSSLVGEILIMVTLRAGVYIEACCKHVESADFYICGHLWFYILSFNIVVFHHLKIIFRPPCMYMPRVGLFTTRPCKS